MSIQTGLLVSSWLAFGTTVAYSVAHHGEKVTEISNIKKKQTNHNELHKKALDFWKKQATYYPLTSWVKP